MKNLLRLMPVLALIVFACTTEPTDLETSNENLFSLPSQPPCLDADPAVRVVNNGTFTYELKVVNGDGVEIVNFGSVPPNTSTPWESFDSGLYNIYLNNVEGGVNIAHDKVNLQMDNCTELEIEIDENDQVVSFVPTTA